MMFRKKSKQDEFAYAQYKDVDVSGIDASVPMQAAEHYPPTRTLIVTVNGTWLWVTQSHGMIWDELAEGLAWINVTLDDPRRDLVLATDQIMSVEDCSERFRKGVTARAMEADRLARDYAEQYGQEAPDEQG